MPGGKGNIKPYEGNTFSSTNQPDHSKRKGQRRWKTVLKDNMPDDGYIVFFDAEVVLLDDKGKPVTTRTGKVKTTGEKVKAVKVKFATKDQIALAAIKQAAKGDIRAIQMIMERQDGKPVQPFTGGEVDIEPVILKLPDGTELTL